MMHMDLRSWALFTPPYFNFFQLKYGIVVFRKDSRIQMRRFYDHSLPSTDRCQRMIDGHGDYLQNKKTFFDRCCGRFGFLLVDIRQMPVLYLPE